MQTGVPQMPIIHNFTFGKIVWSALWILFISYSIAAAQDIERSKDHPLLSRYPNATILEYAKDYSAVEFAMRRAANGNAERKGIEGNRTLIRYFYAADNQPSPLQLIRNYQNAIKKIGGVVVYERLPRDSDSGETTLKVTSGGKEIWIRVEPDIFSAPTQSYLLQIVEIAAMEQVITANKLLAEINKTGFVALYINFETNKWELKEDGLATVREIVAMLKSAPTLKLSIEGHTDNVGAPASNKLLSENRARSVMKAVLAGGIAAGRLTAVGFGQETPVADNRTEEGRAKNRRVELVKK
jgi:outer membrane protein OmpA-like peptidoglycan-associated protein